MIRWCLVLFIVFFCGLAHAFSDTAAHAIVMDYNSGTIIYEHDADAKMAPSSMSKLMTLYVVFNKLKSGIIKMSDVYTISETAWKKGGSSMFLEAGKKVTVKDLIRGVIVVSGNDAAITLAEGISGSEDGFVKEMNATAKELKLQNSHFMNPTGWPDDKHFMSARDLLTLAIRIFEDFPEYYSLFSIKEFNYNNIHQPNTNELLWSHFDVDGIKTGSTKVGGFGVVISAEKDERRIFAVVNGYKSKKERKTEGEKLVQYALNSFENKVLFRENHIIEKMQVWLGQQKAIGLVTHEDVYVTYKKGEKDRIKVTAIHNDVIQAPVSRNHRVGTLEITIPDQKNREIALYPKDDVEKLSFIPLLIRKFEALFD